MVMAWGDVSVVTCFGEGVSVHLTIVFQKNRKGLDVTIGLVIIKTILAVIPIFSWPYPFKLRFTSQLINLNPINGL